MLCDICQKKQATVHLTEIVDEVMAELHLCEDCAREKSIKMEQQFGLSDLIAGLSDFGKATEEVEKTKLICQTCGFAYESFRKNGRLGCSDCYISFKKYLASLLKKIHGSSQHLGKAPTKLPKVVKAKSQLQELKTRLQYLIETEAFEEAAKLRDQIRELEARGRNANESH
ncbi:MAG: UvrB/UvrC motif-containing protein [Candidatus Omnitrophota bacterium]